MSSDAPRGPRPEFEPIDVGPAAEGTPSRTAGFSLLAWLQLFRAPNVFTALADVLAGYLFTHAALSPREVWIPLAAASALIYTAGMVLNDVFDLEVDRRERPNRPLPSGRIGVGTARWAGIEMLLVGAGLGWLAGWQAGTWRCGLVATLLVAAVVLYDAWLKRTPLGPLGMGACRMLNVLLGMSAASGAWHAVHWVIAGGIGLYIVGVTWFARTEATRSNRLPLALATATMLAGLAVVGSFPWWADDRLALVSQPEYVNQRWPLLWCALGLLVAGRTLLAVWDPSPARVQMAVKQGILTLIIIDAAVCFAARGLAGALVIVVLIFPAMFLGRWVYST
jgi:4-hydroxybenzoate polyprenyltransferase